jgi:TetR/AcrR family transcriptional repressor of nem operon
MGKTTKEIKRKKLLAQGVLMLTNQGYHGTGLQDMLDKVKVPKGSFYAYFGSKEAFCVEVIQHYIEPVIQQLKGNLQDPTLNGLTAINKHLDSLVSMYKTKQFMGGCLLGNLIGELGNSNDGIRMALQDAMQRYQRLFSQALATAQQDGLVRDDIPPEKMASLLVNSWQGALLRMQIEQSVEPLESCKDNLLNNYYIN